MSVTGLSRHATSCDDVVCQNGRCILANQEPVCECNLGYTGDSCDKTINEYLSVPLTLGVVAVIIILIIIFFAMAFFRQRLKAKKRKKMADQALLRNGEHL